MMSIKIQKSKVIYFLTIVCTGIYSVVSLFPAYSNIIISLMFIISIVCSFLGIRYRLRTESIEIYYKGIILTSIIMLFMTAINGLTKGSIDFIYFLLDFVSLLFFMSGAYLFSEGERCEETFISIVNSLVVFESLIGIYCLLTVNYNVTLYTRLLDVNTQYKLYSLMKHWPYGILLSTINYRNKKKLFFASVIELAEYVILSFVFLKRTVFVQLLFLMILILFENRKSMGNIFKIAFAIISLVLLLLVFKPSLISSVVNLGSLTFDRFSGQTLDSFDRLQEFTSLFEQFGGLFVIFGRGFSSFHSGIGYANLHIGFLNYIFKGGIVLFGLQLYIFLRILKFYVGHSIKHNGVLACAIFYFMYILFEPSWFPSPFRFTSSCAILLSLRNIDLQISTKEGVYDD